MSIFWAMYREDIWWLGSCLLMVVVGFWGGYQLGKEDRQPRDAKGRYCK